MKTAVLAEGSHVLAHQGGWDEILLVALPLLVIAGLLVLANKRVSAKLHEDATAEDDTKQP